MHPASPEGGTPREGGRGPGGRWTGRLRPSGASAILQELDESTSNELSERGRRKLHATFNGAFFSWGRMIRLPQWREDSDDVHPGWSGLSLVRRSDCAAGTENSDLVQACRDTRGPAQGAAYRFGIVRGSRTGTRLLSLAAT